MKAQQIKQKIDSPLQAKAKKQDSHSSILQNYKDKTAQPKSSDEKELLQGKFDTKQLASEEEEPLQQKPNNTGLPDNLKSGVENLSGYNMDDVKVHYNSSNPATLQAHAYAQGTDIYIAPGQEKHLPHEAWHIIQQKQGRVKPTTQLKGVNVNDNEGLEREADMMGRRALESGANPAQLVANLSRLSEVTQSVIQLRLKRAGLGHLVYLEGSGVIQMFRGGRLVTGLKIAYDTGEWDRAGLYLEGWILDVADYYTNGYLYDTIRLIYSVVGGHGAGTLTRVEEMIRFVQHHPEVITYITQAAPIIAVYFGVPPWAVQIALSRGATADSIGSFLSSLLIPTVLQPYVPVRHLGRSVLDRGLALTHGFASFIPGGGALVSGISRFFHGYAVNPGSLGPGVAMEGPKDALEPLYQLLSNIMPMERLHIIPAKDGGKLHDKNAVYGSAAANSIMIPSERNGAPALAIQSPTGFAESMVMNNGLVRARGVRPREGEIEHKLAGYGVA